MNDFVFGIIVSKNLLYVGGETGKSELFIV